MFNIVLYEPEIPPNTGNIIRLCANAGAQLHLIEPMGFSVDDKQLKRAGLDYHPHTQIHVHANFTAFCDIAKPTRLFAFSTKGQKYYSEISYQAGDFLLFGPETRGLPSELLASLPAEHVLRIPMIPDQRSLNLANTVAIVLYEGWRQLGFIGGR